MASRLARATGLGAALLVPSGATGANKLSIESTVLPLGSAGNAVSILADMDQDTYGFSVHFSFDASLVRVTAVEPGAALAALEPEYFEGTLLTSPGDVTHGVVLDTTDPITKKLAPGSGAELLSLRVDVVAAAPGSALLDLTNVPGMPSRLNVMSDGNGMSVVPPPLLVDGTLTLADLSPSIEGYEGNSGLAGQEFSIVGRNLDQPGLDVAVCGAAAAFTLLADGRTVRATAPPCLPGPAEVKVCTGRGCAADPLGFTYLEPPQPPAIQEITGNRGLAGTTFSVAGVHFGEAGLAVTVCGQPAEFTLLDDGRTLEVTAPACGATGWAPLEVSTSAGSAVAPEGFFYEAPPGAFLRADANDDSGVDLSDAITVLLYLFGGLPLPARCADAADTNDDGKVDLSDAIYLLRYLFQGGPRVPEPYPAPGTDPTGDGLPAC